MATCKSLFVIAMLVLAVVGPTLARVYRLNNDGSSEGTEHTSTNDTIESLPLRQQKPTIELLQKHFVTPPNPRHFTPTLPPDRLDDFSSGQEYDYDDSTTDTMNDTQRIEAELIYDAQTFPYGNINLKRTSLRDKNVAESQTVSETRLPVRSQLRVPLSSYRRSPNEELNTTQKPLSTRPPSSFPRSTSPIPTSFPSYKHGLNNFTNQIPSRQPESPQRKSSFIQKDYNYNPQETSKPFRPSKPFDPQQMGASINLQKSPSFVISNASELPLTPPYTPHLFQPPAGLIYKTPSTGHAPHNQLHLLNLSHNLQSYQHSLTPHRQVAPSLGITERAHYSGSFKRDPSQVFMNPGINERQRPFRQRPEVFNNLVKPVPYNAQSASISYPQYPTRIHSLQGKTPQFQHDVTGNVMSGHSKYIPYMKPGLSTIYSPGSSYNPTGLQTEPHPYRISSSRPGTPYRIPVTLPNFGKGPAPSHPLPTSIYGYQSQYPGHKHQGHVGVSPYTPNSIPPSNHGKQEYIPAEYSPSLAAILNAKSRDPQASPNLNLAEDSSPYHVVKPIDRPSLPGPPYDDAEEVTNTRYSKPYQDEDDDETDDAPEESPHIPYEQPQSSVSSYDAPLNPKYTFQSYKPSQTSFPPYSKPSSVEDVLQGHNYIPVSAHVPSPSHITSPSYVPSSSHLPSTSYGTPYSSGDFHTGGSYSHGGGSKKGVTGPVYTFAKTDKEGHFKWGVRHRVGSQYAGR